MISIIFIILKRTLAHKNLISAVMVGIILSSTIMSGSVIFFDSLKNLSLQETLSSTSDKNIDILVEANATPKNNEDHKKILRQINETIVVTCEKITNKNEYFTKTGTFFSTKKIDPSPASECPCASVKSLSNNEMIECDCSRSSLLSLSSSKNKISILRGKSPSSNITFTDEYILQVEAIIDEDTSEKLNLEIGDIYRLKAHWEDKNQFLEIIISGIYERKNENKNYWSVNDEVFENKIESLDFSYFIINEKIISGKLLDYFSRIRLDYAWWIDIENKKIKAKDTTQILHGINIAENQMKSEINGLVITTELVNTIESFEKDLFFNKIPMQIVIMIIVLVAIYYTITISSLLVEAQKNEIGMLRTRGASTKQIISVFVFEGLILTIIATCAGPIIAGSVISGIGQIPLYENLNYGKNLPVSFSINVFYMSFIGGVLGLISVLAPAIKITNLGLLASKITNQRPSRLSIIQKYYLDVGFILIVMFLLFQISKQGSFISENTIGGELEINQLLLATPAIFIICSGLILVRIFPLMMHFLGIILNKKLFSKLASPELILGIWQMSRNPSHYSRLSLLLILTAALGVFASSFESSLKQSNIDQVLYDNAGEIKLESTEIHKEIWSKSIINELSKSNILLNSSPILRKKSSVSSKYSNDYFELIGVDPNNLDKIILLRNDNKDKNLKEKLNRIDEITNKGIMIPSGSKWISVNIRPLTKLPDSYVLARLSDANNNFFSIPLGNLSPNGYDGFRFHCPENSENEWCRIGVSLQTAISSIRRYRPVEFFPKEPLSLHSIGIYSNNSTEASGLDISDISVIDGSGKNITIIENFSEDYNDSWSTIKPTQNSLGDTISINFSSKNQMTNLSKNTEEKFLRFRWTNIDPREYRGIWHGKGLEEIPALADKNFMKKYNLEIDDNKNPTKVNIIVDSSPIKLNIIDTIELFPSAGYEKEPFIIVDYESLLTHLNTKKHIGNIQPKEFWINASNDIENKIEKPDFIDNYFIDEKIKNEIDDILKNIDLKAGSSTHYLDNELKNITLNPLVIAGWKALLGVAFFTVLIISALGFIIHSNFSFNNRKYELALLRTIGLSMKQLVTLILFEQIIVIGLALGLGIFMGLSLGSTILPYLANSSGSEVLLPPMDILFRWDEFRFTFFILLLVFITVIAIIIFSVFKMSLHKVMRIGK